MMIITFIRHGESEDNSKPIWAGWKDAPLSQLGKRQAKALGEFFSGTRFDHIYTSDLQRAHETARAVHSRLADPKPPLKATPLVREQNFGVAEGKEWIMHIQEGKTREELHKEGIYPVLWERHERFDEGESLDDLAARADAALKECILPHLTRGTKQEDGAGAAIHIAIASHGLAISELVAAVLRLDPGSDKSKSYKGLLNTAWARAEVRLRDGHSGAIDVDSLPPLEVRVTHFNQADHLTRVPQVLVEEDTSNEARAFFGGGGAESEAAVSVTNARVATSGQANL